MFEDVLRFWLDRGVDGFRIDVAHSLFKVESLRDQRGEAATPGRRPQPPATGGVVAAHCCCDQPMWDQPEVHDVYRAWHRVLASYDGDRMAVAEAWTETPEALARYVRPDELLAGVQLRLAAGAVVGAGLRRRHPSTLVARWRRSPRRPTWVLSNHDVTRHPTRYGGGPVGLARARAATLTMLGLPGFGVPLPG